MPVFCGQFCFLRPILDAVAGVVVVVVEVVVEVLLVWVVWDARLLTVMVHGGEIGDEGQHQQHGTIWYWSQPGKVWFFLEKRELRTNFYFLSLCVRMFINKCAVATHWSLSMYRKCLISCCYYCCWWWWCSIKTNEWMSEWVWLAFKNTTRWINKLTSFAFFVDRRYKKRRSFTCDVLTPTVVVVFSPTAAAATGKNLVSACDWLKTEDWMIAAHTKERERKREGKFSTRACNVVCVVQNKVALSLSFTHGKKELDKAGEEEMDKERTDKGALLSGLLLPFFLLLSSLSPIPFLLLSTSLSFYYITCHALLMICVWHNWGKGRESTLC